MLANYHDLRYYVFEKPGLISIVSKVLNSHTLQERSTNETIVAEYTREDRFNPPVIKLYKKSINVSYS